MEWTEQAEDAIAKVPFFVRKKVRKRVEKEAAQTGKNQVTLGEVKATQTRFLSGMDAEIKGYQVETCFGSEGCPNRIASADDLVEQIEALFKQEDILSLLRQQVKGDLKFHHEFRVAVAQCPNGCSQPQIKGIGIISAARPGVTEEACIGCGACVDACQEGAIALTGDGEQPEIDFDRCLMCAKCVKACPTGTLATATQGYRVQLGGRLGRHPRLAMELPGIHTQTQVIEIVKQCIRFYREKSRHGERFSNLLTRAEFEKMVQK
ncbi:4Fe-4S dicluster domain-containing protein [Desulforapulum autotrophicum]|nr:4Fe-4S dicluster domain-containing protein [Desulforapulum autotrophicum]